jgi:hypothetical protein
MNSKISMVKSLAVAVALAAGVSGSALANDSSLNPFTGDSFALCSAVIHVAHDFVGFTTPTTASPRPTQANIRDATRPLPLARARAHPPPIHVGT